MDNTITPDGVYKLVRRYALAFGLKIGAHALRAAAAIDALDDDADIAKVQELLGTPISPPPGSTIGAK
jgi:site-specific recombinase XerD